MGAAIEMRHGDRTIKLPQEIAEACAGLTSATEQMDTKQKRIARLPLAVGSLNAIAEGLPDPYPWRFKTVAALTDETQAMLTGQFSIGELNDLYWRDTLATIEAYTVMSIWRMIDIAKAAFALVEDEAFSPAAILARSALESAIQFIHDARTIAPTLEDLAKLDLSAAMVQSETLEAFLLQTVYASRLSDADTIYKSKNILTSIGKIAKIAPDDPISAEYETLCELTHPNFLGRSIYVTDSNPGARPGDELRFISHRNGLSVPPILQSTLWALSWAIEGQATGTHLVQNSVGTMATTLKNLRSPDGRA